ncbi:MAG: GTPase HflX [Chloroflexi bacterium]|nr:GTPase HflX [Chloroflexota bacterium]MBT7082363.1 GTPase HflX [Chloroflexota bacterium]MBT7289186.1 GTPase HflX [Chloroflexota bacterium]
MGTRTPKSTQQTKSSQEKAFLVAVEPKRSRNLWTAKDSLEELAGLAWTAGAKVVGRMIQSLDVPSRNHYIGKGKIQELIDLKEEVGYGTVIFDDELTPTQQRNIEDLLKVKVIDRTALILDIFAARAQTHEGRLQVELAQHKYLLPRLAGQWQHLERLGGGIGTRGPGESQIETDRRLVRTKIDRLNKEIKKIQRHREVQRKQRKDNRIPTVALIGYTNAGKSTLLNTLCKAGVFVQDKLFATLDPTTRRYVLPDNRKILITDTVGFIQKLPHSLVASFRATLEELHFADLLLHVIDITHDNAAEQTETVNDLLGELDLQGKPVVLVCNKIDLLFPEAVKYSDDAAMDVVDKLGIVKTDDTVFISAVKKWGFDKLLDAISAKLV